MTAMTTFEQARETVRAAVEREWQPDDGTLFVAGYGWQDAEYWRVEAGAREYLIDGDRDFEPLDAPIWLVRKDTGALEIGRSLTDWERVGAMTRIGKHPAESVTS